MLLKRSISPDGRIDSVSVEFSMPVSDVSNGEIKDKALKTLQLQKGNCERVPEAQRREGTGQRRSNSRARATGNQSNGEGSPSLTARAIAAKSTAGVVGGVGFSYRRAPLAARLL